MPEQSAVGLIDTIVILLYLSVIGYLGWLGYKGTRSASDYLLAGRKAHPFVMAVSYGATFISTAAIVGFGGVAGLFGMSLMWLTFLNIAIGILLAFTLLGEPTRRIGHRLGAHTFPEFLGRRYQSRFIQVLAGLLIFLFMPLYAAAVLTGGSVFAAAQFGIDFHTALLVFGLVTAGYVIAGGLKAVMYTDSLQGIIMGLGMLILVVFTYYSLGGFTEGNRFLTDMADMVPAKLQAIGHQGWTSMPRFGWGDTAYDLWWVVVSAIILGVGIGALAQPQLVVRFMTVRSRRELNRAVPVGAVFILIMVSVPYMVGSLSNAWFVQNGPLLHGRVAEVINADKGRVRAQLMREDDQGNWSPVRKNGKPAIVPLSVESRRQARNADGENFELISGRSVVIVYTKGQADKVMPIFITSAMPHWFGLLFFLTLMSAAMSTLSSQFHALGTSAGRDVYEQLRGGCADGQPNILVVRLAIVVGLIVAVSISHTVRAEYVIARFTAIFFGLCASTFLPAYIGGLFFKGMTRTGAIASMLVGLGISLFWLLLVKSREASAIGLVQWLTDGNTSILADQPNWPVVDPILIAFPLSIITAVLVSALTRRPDDAHLARCFPDPKEKR